MICVREMFKDGPDISLHDGGGRFAGEGQDIISGEGGGAPMASKEGDGRVCDTCMLSDVHPYLFEEGGGIPLEGFIKSYAHVTGFMLNDSSGCSSHFQTQ